MRRITALADRRIALACRFAQWTLVGIEPAARCGDRHPAQLHELGADAPPITHLTGNTALPEVEKQLVQPALAEWTMSPRAQSVISHTAAETWNSG